MQQVTTIGLDLAKNLFQVHGADAQGRPVLRRRLAREKVPVRAAREIRAIARSYGIDVLGANCLGVAAVS